MSPSRRGMGAIEVSIIFSGLATFVVFLRLYTRFFVVRYFRVEEYLITLAMLCSIGLTICIGIQVKYGMGQHIWEVDPTKMPNSLKAFWASLITYYLSLGLTKSSILLQYQSVFPLRRVRTVCWSLLFIVTCYTIWTLCGSVFACIPVHAFWTRQKPSKCLNQFAMWFTNAAINIATDFAIVIVPIPIIKNLNLPRRQKQALIGIFAIGGFVCVVSILRLQSLVAISNSEDPTYDNPPAATWSSIEINVGIICSCLPCLRPLAARVLPGVFSSAHKSGANSARPRVVNRRQLEPETMLERIDSRCSRSHGGENSGDDIRVVTEVHVRVEKNIFEPRFMFGDKVVSITNGDSTETLVTDVAPVI